MTPLRVLFQIAALGLTLALAPLPTTAQQGPIPVAPLCRYPDVSADRIVFVCADDLWMAPRGGGEAKRLTRLPGRRLLPRFSQDGRRIAFVSNHEGVDSLYTLPVDGGTPLRVTHQAGENVLCDWTRDGHLLFAANTFSFTWQGRVKQLFTVPSTGGLPRKLPLAYGAEGALTSDGTRLAYVPRETQFDSWRRYRGGAATDLRLLDLRSGRSSRLTTWPGVDCTPMWRGTTLYFLSDAGPEERLNLWALDTATGRRRQVTHFREYDLKFPSIGPGPQGRGEIVFQYRAELYLLPLPAGPPRRIPIHLPESDRANPPRTVDAAQNTGGWDASPDGASVTVEARGDVWTAPAVPGDLATPRNLTGTSGIAERDPAWSPDGKWIAYFSDASGNYELYVRPAAGPGQPQPLSRIGRGFRYRPVWSPDSRSIVFSDSSGGIYLTSLERRVTERIDRDPLLHEARLTWSPDSRWLAYVKGGNGPRPSISLYSVAAHRSHPVTSGRFADDWPVFDRRGDYLYFVSVRDFTSLLFDPINYPNFIYTHPDQLLVVPLRRGVPAPWAAAGGATRPDPASGPVRIDLEGFEGRALPLRLPPGELGSLAPAADGSLIFTRKPVEGEASIERLDVKEPPAGPLMTPKVVVGGTTDFRLIAGGTGMVVRKGDQVARVSVVPDQKLDRAVRLVRFNVEVDPRAEWRQIYNEAWRIYRDFFYDAAMHGVDWPAVREHYRPLLEACASRDDLNYVLGEMLSELSTSHVIPSSPGDVGFPTAPAAGMPNADFELANGAFRIKRLYEGPSWEVDARNPLRRPGNMVQAGEYLLAVNGKPLDTGQDPWAAFAGLAGQRVVLTVGPHPAADHEARRITTTLPDNEIRLRQRAWMEANRAWVEKQSGGRVGYVCVPDTYLAGTAALGRQLFSQSDKQALIIDDRWNEGGHMPDRLVEMLDRPLFYYNRVQNGSASSTPAYARGRPKCMLINGMAGSGGDSFPYFFRQRGVGKLIGTKTTGALRGAGGRSPSFIDGGRFEVPHIGLFSPKGEWMIEGRGVPPDIEVIDDPAEVARGRDRQLETALHVVLRELRERPYVRTPHPPAVAVGLGLSRPASPAKPARGHSRR